MYKQNKIIRMNKCAVCMCTCFFARSAIERAACMFGLRYSSSSFIKTPPGDPGMARQSHYLGSTLGGGEVGGEGINQSINQFLCPPGACRIHLSRLKIIAGHN